MSGYADVIERDGEVQLPLKSHFCSGGRIEL